MSIPIDSSLLLRRLPSKFLDRVSYLLNPECRDHDWRALAGEMNFTLEDVNNIGIERDPTHELVKRWELKNNDKLSLIRLMAHLENIKREDAIADLKKLYVEYENRSSLPADPPAPTSDYTILGNYDVFISFEKNDISFAKEIRQRLEDENFTVCMSYTDFLPGFNELEQICQVIEEKCRKVIVIMSEKYNKCDACDFQAKVAISLSPNARKHKVIPILYENCEPHPMLKFLTRLNYTDPFVLPYFWKNLIKSLSVQTC